MHSFTGCYIVMLLDSEVFSQTVHHKQTLERWMLFKKELKSVYCSRHFLLCCFASLSFWWFIFTGFSVKAATKNNDEPGKRKHSPAMPAVHVFDAILDDNFLL